MSSTHITSTRLDHFRLSHLLIPLLGVLFLALLSKCSIPLPFTPVPLTLQTFALFILSGLLGSRLSVYTVSVYLIAGTLGLPVFASTPPTPLWFLDPKAGFLLSFLPASYLMGKMIDAGPRHSLLFLLLTTCVGQLTISLLGMVWLSIFVGMPKAFLLGVAPFWLPSLMKMGSASLALFSFYRVRSN